MSADKLKFKVNFHHLKQIFSSNSEYSPIQIENKCDIIHFLLPFETCAVITVTIVMWISRGSNPSNWAKINVQIRRFFLLSFIVFAHFYSIWRALPIHMWIIWLWIGHTRTFFDFSTHLNFFTLSLFLANALLHSILNKIYSYWFWLPQFELKLWATVVA